MKVIIEIGHYKYLLPNDKGVAAIVAALSRSKIVRRDNSEPWQDKKNRYVEIEEEGPQVQVTTVADSVKIRIRKEEEEIEEEADDELLGLPMHLLGLPENGTRQD